MAWDVAGKTILVTGATSGIGLEASVLLARKGASVVMVGRDAKKTEACVAQVKERAGSQAVRGLLCDFTRQAEIRKLAAEVLATCPQLHVLVNNAGTVYAERTLTPDGIESTFAVNHLGYFLLTNLLLERIVESAPARIVNVASQGHYRGTLNFDDLGFAKGGYGTMAAYARSKLGNVLFTNELARRLAGRGVTVNSLHPGAVATNIWSHGPRWAVPIIKYLLSWSFISAAKGGENLARLALAPELDGVTGKYFDQQSEKTASALALDEALAKKLWTASEELTQAR